jgi:hypothetical protein
MTESETATTFTKLSDREIVLTRVFDAPREAVFRRTRIQVVYRDGGDRKTTVLPLPGWT